MRVSAIVALAGCMALAPLRSTRAAPTAEPTVQPAAAPVQASPPPDPKMQARSRTLKAVGGTSLGTGIGLVALSGIFWGLRNTALRRADRQKFYVDEQRLIQRARRRQIVTGVGLGVGAAMTLTGVALLIVGARVGNGAHRRVTTTPTLAPRYSGLTTTVRF